MMLNEANNPNPQHSKQDRKVTIKGLKIKTEMTIEVEEISWENSDSKTDLPQPPCMRAMRASIFPIGRSFLDEILGKINVPEPGKEAQEPKE